MSVVVLQKAILVTEISDMDAVRIRRWCGAGGNQVSGVKVCVSEWSAYGR